MEVNELLVFLSQVDYYGTVKIIGDSKELNNLCLGSIL